MWIFLYKTAVFYTNRWYTSLANPITCEKFTFMKQKQVKLSADNPFNKHKNSIGTLNKLNVFFCKDLSILLSSVTESSIFSTTWSVSIELKSTLLASHCSAAINSICPTWLICSHPISIYLSFENLRTLSITARINLPLCTVRVINWHNWHSYNISCVTWVTI